MCDFALAGYIFLINLRAGLEPVTSLLKLSVKQLQCETFA